LETRYAEAVDPNLPADDIAFPEPQANVVVAS
jgi:hypothetical protein